MALFPTIHVQIVIHHVCGLTVVHGLVESIVNLLRVTFLCVFSFVASKHPNERPSSSTDEVTCYHTCFLTINGINIVVGI